MVGFGVILLIVAFIAWSLKRSADEPAVRDVTSTASTKVDPSEVYVRFKIAKEIRAQVSQYKTAAQKKVVEEMALTVEYFASHPYVAEEVQEPAQVVETEEEVQPEREMSYAYDPSAAMSGGNEMDYNAEEATTQQVTLAASSQSYETPWKKLQFFDGAVVLLYLGAFFLLSSIGLYIGLGTGTTIKAILATLIAAVFYVGGIALYSNSSRLKPAGQTFVAIGMATIPMAGAALYYYAFNQTHGPIVWLMTSLLMLAVYVHALYTLRSPLVSYLIIFSSISLVLSGVSSVGLAPFYLIQGLGLSGVLFALLSRLLPKNIAQIRESYEQSAAYLVPFSVGLSVLFFSKTGFAQVAFSLLVSCVYYAYVAFEGKNNREVHVLLTQATGIAAVLCGSYSIFHSVVTLSGMAITVSLLYSLVWVLWARELPQNDQYKLQIVAFMYGLPALAFVIFLSHPYLLWVPVLALCVQGLLQYGFQRDIYSGLTWTFALLSLPALIGELGMDTPISLTALGAVYAVLLAACLVVDVFDFKKLTSTDRTLQELTLGIALGTSGLLFLEASNTAQVILLCVQMTVLVLHSFRAKIRNQWLSAAAMVQLLWLFVFIDSVRLLTDMVLFVGVFNFLVVLIKKQYTFHDWLVTSAFFAVPAMWWTLVDNTNIKPSQFIVSYSVLCALFLAMRIRGFAIEKVVLYISYILSLLAALTAAFVQGSWVAVAAFIAASLLFLWLERIESEHFYGYIAPLVPFVALMSKNITNSQLFWVVIFITILAMCITAIRKRTYESVIAVSGLLFLPWYIYAQMDSLTSNITAIIYVVLAWLLLFASYTANKNSKFIALKVSIISGYLLSLALAVLFMSGFWSLSTVLVVGVVLLLSAEKIENDLSTGYLAVLLPLLAFKETTATHEQYLLVIVFTTVLSLCLLFFKKRAYEAFVAVVGLLILPYFAEVVVYKWGVTTLVSMYMALSCTFVLCRLLLSSQKLKSALQAALTLGYISAISFGLIASFGASWQVCSFALFVSSILIVAVSYIENSPLVIIAAFTGAYAFIWRLATGIELPFSSLMILYLILSQGVYWLLIGSKLRTYRAQISRYFQLSVAAIIPFSGIIRGEHMMAFYPIAGIGFACMFLYEVWRKGQSARETALFLAHAFLLWMFYILGVRELQVYTQLTAAVIAGFAFWRRRLKDTPAVINQYIWTGVLIFSVPMVWQAVTSGNVTYAYLVLVEHVVLTVLSIILKRATFAWWGIAVIVGSVLYQLRKLRYAALAFLGIFIISLAVYFLLKYNKPAEK